MDWKILWALWMKLTDCPDLRAISQHTTVLHYALITTLLKWFVFGLFAKFSFFCLMFWVITVLLRPVSVFLYSSFRASLSVFDLTFGNLEIFCDSCTWTSHFVTFLTKPWGMSETSVLSDVCYGLQQQLAGRVLRSKRGHCFKLSVRIHCSYSDS